MEQTRWDIKDLTEVVFYQEGPGVRKNQYTNQGVKLLNVTNLQKGKIRLDNSDRYISEEEAYGKYSHFLVDEGDLILASSGIKVEYLHEKMGFVFKEHLPLCMNTSTIRFKSLNKDVLDIRYFMYFLKSVLFKNQIGRLMTGSAQLNFGPSHLKQIQLPVPPLKLQQRIAKVLDKAQELIDKRLEQIDANDELVKGLFEHMFGNPQINHKEWEKSLFDKVMVTSPQNGLYKPANFYVINGGTPIIRIDSFYNGALKNIASLKRVSCEKKELDIYGLQENDIVINRVNSIEYLGKCALIKGLIEPTVFESNMMRISIDTTKVNARFITELLCTKYIYNQILNKAKKSINQASINQKDVNSFELILPPIELQNRFAEQVEKIEQQKQLLQQSLTELENNFNAMMQRAFKGELF